MRYSTRLLRAFQLVAVFGLVGGTALVVWGILAPINILAVAAGAGFVGLSIIVLLLTKEVMDWR